MLLEVVAKYITISVILILTSPLMVVGFSSALIYTGLSMGWGLFNQLVEVLDDWFDL